MAGEAIGRNRIRAFATVVVAGSLAAAQLHFAEQQKSTSAGAITQLSFAQRSAATFTNPLLPAGADPWAMYKNGWYYYTHTTGRNLTWRKTRSISDLGAAEVKVVWTPPSDGPYSKDIWAPELHFDSDVAELRNSHRNGPLRAVRLSLANSLSSSPSEPLHASRGI